VSRHFSRLWPVLAMAFFLLGCASESVIQSEVDGQGIPLWVKQGSNIVNTGTGRVFLGVGSAPMLGDFSLQTATANNRARAEVGRVLSSYMEIVSRNYIASGQAREANFNAQSVAKQIDKIDGLDLTNIQVIDHWRDEKNNVMYAVAKLDMKKAKSSLKRDEIIHNGLRNYINEEGDTIFDRIAQHEAKPVADGGDF
jgi:hypothetical protein